MKRTVNQLNSSSKVLDSKSSDNSSSESTVPVKRKRETESNRHRLKKTRKKASAALPVSDDHDDDTETSSIKSPVKRKKKGKSNRHILKKIYEKASSVSSDLEEYSNDSAETTNVKSPVKRKKKGKSNEHTLKKTLKKASAVLPDTENYSDDTDTSSVKSPVEGKKKGKSYRHTLKKTCKKASAVSSDLEEYNNDSADSINVNAGEADMGIIEKVKLKNFMCHSNLEFKFGPHVNFILGRNGSGKSAILSGIMIALGSRASNTGRSQNLAGYIQTNKQTAFTSVTIRNTGPDAFLPDVYGSRIIVERRIGQDGHSNYNLKATTGQSVSGKKEDLTNILDALNIQVENPVSILTQDASKCLLDSKDIRKKYELFFKATQLEKLKEQYNEAEANRQQASLTLRIKKKVLPNAKEEVLRLQSKVQNIQHLNSQRERRHSLQNELAWAVVTDAENKEKEARELVEKFKEELENLQQKIEEANENMDLCHKNIAELNKKGTAAKNEMNMLRIIHTDALRSHQDHKRDYGILQVKHDNTMMKIDTINAERVRVQNTLDELAQRSQDDLNTEKEQRKQRVLELEQIGHNLANSCQELGKKLQEQNDTLLQKEDSILTMGKEIENLGSKIKHKQNEIEAMTSSISNQEYLFGAKMPFLRQRIKTDCKKFQQEPIGPLGLYVKIVQAKWSLAVEKCLSHSFLQAFCCDNVNDSQTLRAMMKEVLGPSDNPNIIISKFLNKAHDVSPNKVQSDFQTVYDMVTSDNPIILNCLIDQKMIENVLLIENSSIAINLMLHSPPPNCHYAYTITGDQIYPDPNYRYYSCKQKTNSYSLLQRYGVSDIRTAEQQMNSFKQAIAARIQKKDTGKNAIKAMKTCIYNLQVEQNEIKKMIKDNDQQKIECQNATSNQLDVSAMHAELESQLKLENKFKFDLNLLKEEIKEKTEKSQIKKKEADELDAAINLQVDIRKTVMHDVEVVEQTRARLIKEKKNFENRLEKDKSLVKDAQKHHADVQRDLEVAIEAASKVCNRVPTTKSVNILKSELKELEAVLREQTMNINIEETIENFVRKRKQLIISETEIRNLKESIRNLKVIMIDRQIKFDEIRTLMTLRVQYLFQMNLSARSFSGRLIFDHDAMTLTIVANPNTTEKLASDEINPNRKTSSLSGGERSFVTVALLMALSDTSEMPFHILDEYDVFMDNINKEQSLKMMIEKANEQWHSQFIFLSPLDLPPSAFMNESLIQIQRMPDPERGEVRPVEELEE